VWVGGGGGGGGGIETCAEVEPGWELGAVVYLLMIWKREERHEIGR